MSGWACPYCSAEHAAGSNPDHWNDGCRVFEFECDCGKSFQVEVDWEPLFYVSKL